MVETPLSHSSSSSCASFGSFDDITVKSISNNSNSSVKFVCSYGGKILPRYPDGKLRYFGGDTRVLAINRSVPFSELQAKLGEMCGWSCFSLRCQLPTEDLDALVSITSDEDLSNLIEEYDLSNGPLKIRAFLHETPPPPSSSKPLKYPSPPPASSSTTRSRRCVHHQQQQQHQNQIYCAPSRFSGGGRSTRDPRLCDTHHHQHHHQHHHEHDISRNHRYLVHH